MSLDDRIQPTVDAALARLHGQVAAEVRALVSDLVGAALAERDAIAHDVRMAAQAEAGQALREALVAAQARADEALAAARAEANEAVATTRAEAERAVADARAQTDEAVAAARAQARAQVDHALAAARATAEQAIAAARAQAEAAVAAAREEADEAAAASRALADEAIAAVRAESDEAIAQSAAAARVAERQADLAAAERLLVALRRLDWAVSLSEVLDALGAAAAREAGRVAVLVLRGDRLRGWSMFGFGHELDARSLDLSLDAATAGILSEVVRTGRAVATAAAGADGPGFAALPAGRAGLGVPVPVGGRVVALVYADAMVVADGERTVPGAWPEAIEVLARHAGRCLEALTVAKILHLATPGSESAPGEADPDGTVAEADRAARRYARLLVSDIKLNHESDVAEGHRAGNLLERLRPEIDRARRLYEERVPRDVRARTQYFEQELIHTLAGGNRELLGLGHAT